MYVCISLTPIRGPVCLIDSDLGRKGGKKLGIHPLDDRVDNRMGDNLEPQALVSRQRRPDIARVNRHAHDAVGLVSASILDAQQPVTALADSVALHMRLGDMVVQVVQVDAAVLRRILPQSERGKPHDADGIGGLGSGRRDQRRGQQLGQEESTDAVHAQSKLVALRRLEWGVGRPHHDASVVEKDVQLGFLREEGLRGGFDLGQVGEVEREEDQLAFRLGRGLLNVYDGFCRLLLGAASDVDLGVLSIEDTG